MCVCVVGDRLKLDVSYMQYYDNFVPMTGSSLTDLSTQHNKVLETKQQLGFDEMKTMHVHPRIQMRAILLL